MSVQNRFKARFGIDANNITITNLADPSAATDAVTKQYAANASNITTGTLSSTVLGNSSTYVGTTAIALNRASANQAITGILSVALPGSTSGTITLIPTAVAGTNTITLPAVTGTVITTGDTGTVTSAMIATGTIVDGDISASAAIAISKLAASTISGVSLGGTLNTLTLAVSGTGLSGSATYNGSAGATFTVTSNATSANTASTIVARDASGNFTAGTITAALTGNASTATTLQTARLINGVSFNGSADITVADSTKLPLAGGTLTGALTLAADPTSALHAATKQYVDNIAAGIDWKQSVIAATTTNIATLAGGAPNTLDGVTLAANNRVLVKNQTTTSQNGIYVVTTLGTGANGTWTRATDMDSTSPINEVNSAAVFIEQGTTQADTGWVQTANVATLGTDAITFVQFTGGGSSYTAGTGLTLSANQFSITPITQSTGSSFSKISVNGYGQITGNTAVAKSDLTALGVADDTAVVHIAGTETITGAKTFSSTVSVNPSVIITNTGNTGNNSIEIGHNGVSTPFIDFHSSGNVVDYDSRIIANGGTATAGNGNLSLYASTITIPATTASTSSTTGALIVSGGLGVAGTSSANMFLSANGTSTSLTTGAAWFSAGGGAILFDDNAHKRISWNDGGGNFNIRAGNYFNGTTTTYVKGTGDANSGAASIIMNSDGADGSIQFSTAVIGTPGVAVSYANTVTIGTTQVAISATTASTSSSTGALVVSGGVGIAGALNVAGAIAGSNLSGTNTGDETAATIKSKLGITTLSGSNTGDQTITLTGDVTGSGTGSFATTLATVTQGTGSSFVKITLDTKGRVTGNTAVAKADLTGLGVADDSLVVHLAGTETITGAKTLSAITTVSNATASSSSTSGALVVSGGIGVGGNVVSNGYISGSGGVGALQAVGGSASSWYNAMIRNDGSSVYLLSSAVQTTQALATNATWNSYRPFSWNLSTGAVSIATDGSQTNFGGNISILDNKNIYVGTGNDLYLIHDGTNTSITNQTGNLSITNTSAAVVLQSYGTTGSNFELWSTAAYLDATTSNFRSQDGSTLFGQFNSNGLYAQNATDWPIRSLSSSTTNTSRGGYLQQRSNAGAAVVSGTVLGGLSAGGHNGTSLTSGWNGGAELLFTTTEAWSGTANGTKFTLGVSANGATSPTTRLTIDQDGTTTVNGALTVSGNLTINGTTTTVNSTTVTVDDPIITLGGDIAPAADDNKDRGVEFRWHNGTAAKVGFFGFDDSTGYLTFIPDATNTAEVFSGTQGDIQATNFRGNLIGGTVSGTTLTSTVATGTAPLTVSSTTVVSNLNADMLDGNHASAFQTALGFTPVQQGGGTGQGSNKIYVGWLGSNLGLQVDSTNFSSTWPISVTGNAATATNADTVDSKHVGTSGNAIPLMDGTNTWSGVQTFTNGINPGAAAYPVWEGNVDFGANVANTWLKIVGATLVNTTYSTVGFEIEIIDPQANHATSGSQDSIIKETYYVACVRANDVTANTPDACYVSGPSNRLRAIKTAQGVYEIQIQNLGQYREYNVKVRTYASNGTHTIAYFNGATGGTATATYTAASGASRQYFQNVWVSSTTASTSTTTGALTVSGGVGIAGNTYFGGPTNASISSSSPAHYIYNSGSGDQIHIDAIGASMVVGNHGRMSASSFWTPNDSIGFLIAHNKYDYGNGWWRGIEIADKIGQTAAHAEYVGVAVNPSVATGTTTALPSYYGFRSIGPYWDNTASHLTINNTYHFQAQQDLTNANYVSDNVYGFYSNIVPTAGKTSYNFYAASASPSYFGGPVDSSIDRCTTGTLTTSAQTQVEVPLSLSASVYRTVEYLVQITSGTSYHSSKVLVVHDGANTWVTEYATLITGSSLVATTNGIVVDISGGNIRLLVTPASATSTTFKVVAQAIKV